MIKAFFWSKRWFVWAYGAGLILFLLLYAQVSMTVKFNEWYGGFYDILQKIDRHTFNEFYQKLIEFTKIAVGYILLATATNFATRIYSLRWREAITFDYLPRWRNVQEEIEGASQRIQEDAYRFARIVESLGLQIARAVMTLVAFLPILWALSQKGITVPYAGTLVGQGAWFLLFGCILFYAAYSTMHKCGERTLFFPKRIWYIIFFALFVGSWFIAGFLNSFLPSLVWVAVLVSIGGTIISWFVGIKLPGLEYNNQKVEAAFRKELVYGEDNKRDYASLETLAGLFAGIKFNYHRLFFHYGYFDLWANLFGQIMVIVPFVIGGPALFAGVITLGALIQISNAFDKVQNSFGLFIDNWTTITELRSIWKRLREFEKNLDRFQPQPKNEENGSGILT